MEVQLSEETSCDCPSEDQKKVELDNEVEIGRSNLTPHEFATDDATPSEAILVTSIIQGDDTPQSDCSCTEETKVETETSILLDREVNNSSGWQKPIENGDCSEGIPRIESDKLCENASVESSKNNNGATSLETVSISNDRLNMADNQRGSICIEMECITERNDAENVICDKISPQNSETTIIYVSEGDNSEIETDVCRICHCSDELEVLISPCSCTGSVKFVHHSCLMNWLQRAVMSKCELCLFPLAVKRKRKPFYKVSLSQRAYSNYIKIVIKFSCQVFAEGKLNFSCNLVFTVEREKFPCTVTLEKNFKILLSLISAAVTHIFVHNTLSSSLLSNLFRDFLEVTDLKYYLKLFQLWFSYFRG